MALHKLVFDTTDATSRAAGAQVGAVLYDAANDRLGVINAAFELTVHDADVLAELAGGISIDDGGGSITVDAIQLDIDDLNATDDAVQAWAFDGTGNAIGSTAGALNVNIASGSVVITDGGGSITVDAVQLDIDDLNATDDAVQAWMFDGTGNAISSTSGAINAYVTNNDFCDTAIKVVPETVGVAAAVILDGADLLASRKFVYLYNNGNKAMYIGPSGVTLTDGFPIFPGSLLEARIGPSVALYAISDAAAQNMRTMQLS